MEGAVVVAKEKSFLASLPAAIWFLSGAIISLHVSCQSMLPVGRRGDKRGVQFRNIWLAEK